MKKLISGILAIAMLTCVTIGLSGCSLVEDYLPEYETEYFRYAVRTNKDGTKEGYLIGFTELGAEQEYLILPNEIEGVPIVDCGYMRNYGLMNTEYVGEGNYRSDQLVALYIPFEIKGKEWSEYFLRNLREKRIVQWKTGRIVAIACDEVVCGFRQYKYLVANKAFLGTTHYNNILANISYMYNYEEAPDDGYYWVDSYAESTVEFIPPEPTREGYSFGGWYKEAECVNKWDFETDKTGKELPIKMHIVKQGKEQQYSESDGVHLYAKWIKQ